AVSWIAVRQVLFHTVDETLRDRVEGVRRFMDHQIGALSVDEIRDEFKEHSVLGPGGDLFQVYGCIVLYPLRAAMCRFHFLRIFRQRASAETVRWEGPICAFCLGVLKCSASLTRFRLQS